MKKQRHITVASRVTAAIVKLLVSQYGISYGPGATLPGALVCLILLVTVSLATYKKSASVMPDTAKTV